MSTQSFTTTPRRLLRLPEVLSIIGMKRSWLFNEIANGRFERPIKIGRASCWDSAVVEDYVAKLIAKRGNLPKVDGQPEAQRVPHAPLSRGERRGLIQ